MKMKFFAFVLSLFLVSPAFAEESLFLSLERDGQKSDFISSETVSRESIEKASTKPGVLDLISSVPGVLVSKAASQIKSDISIRGMGDSFRRIGLFIDGRPEKMSVYGCGVSQTILSGNVGRVEIIKTPDSVLYGSDGFGGLINIKTVIPSEPFEGNVSASYGSYNTQNYFANLGGRTNKLIYNVAVNKVSSDGHITNSGYDAQDYYAKFGYRIDGESELIISGKYFTGKEKEPKARAVDGTLVPQSSYDYDRGGADIRYNREFNKGNMEIVAYANFGEHEFSNNWHSKDEMYGLSARFSSELFDGNKLTYGGDYRYSYGKVLSGSPKIGDWNKYEFAFFALDEYEITERAKTFAGARYNYDEKGGAVFVPRAGLSYKLSDIVSARGVYSRGFRNPYLNELYTLPISNEELKAEIQNNYEIGLNLKYDSAEFDLTGFVINGDNIIAVRKGKFSNSGSYVFKGFELSAAKEIIEHLKLFAAYSYIDPDDKTTGIAKNKIDLSADYEIGKFSIHAGGMILIDYYAADGKQVKLNNFNVFNAKINYNINDNLSVFVAADNFTNQKYEMYMLAFGNARIYEMPKASYTAGIKYKF